MIKTIVGMVLIFNMVAVAATSELFPRSKELLPNIAFWTKVYGEWTTEQIAITDSEDLRMIYTVIDVPPIGERFQGLNRDQLIKSAKQSVISALNELEIIRPQSEFEVSGLTQQIYIALKEVNRPDKYRRIDSIRAQNGLRNRFERGYQLSGAHELEIKARLKRHGVPEELIAIVFVESLFYNTSLSHAGAAGIWQFVRATAKEFIHVNKLVDERYDPVIATEAAIRYLKGAKERLREWPLAITSYNHGRAGMIRAVEQLNSRDLVYIINNYKSRSFGFASKNYYAEFLAALDVYRKAEQIFPKVRPLPHWSYSVVELPNAIFAQDLISAQVVDGEWLSQYNPALTSHAKGNVEAIPAGFKLRIPEGHDVQFYKKFKVLSDKQLSKASSQLRARHKANGRQRVFDIAKTYDIFHDQLARRLGYEPSHRPKKGSVILVRSSDSRFTEIPMPLTKANTLEKDTYGNDSFASVP